MTMNRKVIVAVFLLVVLLIFLVYLIPWRSTSSTVLFVNPKTVQGKVGDNFVVNVSVSNVTDLYGYEFSLSWNPAILNVTIVTEGPFLRSGGGTYFYPQINGGSGRLKVDCGLIGSIPGVSGQGTLAIIQFHVKEGGTCDLDLYDTQLDSSTNGTIAHTVNSGRFSV
jgi:hypothetical protein